MEAVEEFEETIAEYCGSYYAVAIDCCTNAIFLSLMYLKHIGEINSDTVVSIPKRTYHQVPRTVERAGLKKQYKDIHWKNFYRLLPTRIVDGALYFQKNMYLDNSLFCISFNYRKPIPIGKGGMILVDSIKEKKWFDNERYNRYMYMTPESAMRGISLFNGQTNMKHGYSDYEVLDV